MNDSPTRWLDRFVGGCFALLIGAMALFGAVQLVSAVWIELAIGVFVILAASVGVWLWLRRRTGW